MVNKDLEHPRPFLRWVGGKARIVDRLLPFVPDVNDGAYFEPFVGGASLFFRLSPTSAILGDSNADLIDCYNAVAERPDLVWRYLRPMIALQSREDFQSMRAKFNATTHSPRREPIHLSQQDVLQRDMAC